MNETSAYYARGAKIIAIAGVITVSAVALTGCANFGAARSAIAAAKDQTDQAIELTQEVNDGALAVWMAAGGATRTGAYLRTTPEKQAAIRCLVLENACGDLSGVGRLTVDEVLMLQNGMRDVQ